MLNYVRFEGDDALSLRVSNVAPDVYLGQTESLSKLPGVDLVVRAKHLERKFCERLLSLQALTTKEDQQTTPCQTQETHDYGIRWSLGVFSR